MVGLEEPIHGTIPSGTEEPLPWSRVFGQLTLVDYDHLIKFSFKPFLMVSIFNLCFLVSKAK